MLYRSSFIIFVTRNENEEVKNVGSCTLKSWCSGVSGGSGGTMVKNHRHQQTYNKKGKEMW